MLDISEIKLLCQIDIKVSSVFLYISFPFSQGRAASALHISIQTVAPGSASVCGSSVHCEVGAIEHSRWEVL